MRAGAVGGQGALGFGPPTVFMQGSVMARGINKVILIGNLGQDPETRTTPGGTTVTNIRIATSRKLARQDSPAR